MTSKSNDNCEFDSQNEYKKTSFSYHKKNAILPSNPMYSV